MSRHRILVVEEALMDIALPVAVICLLVGKRMRATFAPNS